MSGRRRRDDGSDDGHVEAKDERRDPWADGPSDEWADSSYDARAGSGRDPWADSSVDEWGEPGRDRSGFAGRPGVPSDRGYQARNGAGAYVSNDAARNAAPAFPSFQAPGGRGQGPQTGGYEPAQRGGDRYGAGPGYGGPRERGSANGHDAAGYNGDGYQDSGYGRMARRDAAGYDEARGGSRNGSGRNGNGRPGGPAHAPEFTPADNVDIEEDGPTGMPRPYGRLSIYTLHDDKAREFDRLAERAAEGVRTSEPDTLVYVIHVVPKAPMQRIIYEIYRDRAAFLTHERQPHIRQFAADRASCVLATNIIDLRLKYAKVASLGSSAEAPMPPQANRMPRVSEPAAGGGRQPAAGTQQAAAQHPPNQYAATQYSRTQQPNGASFTPAADRYADTGQPTVGRETFPPAAQYGSSGAGGYGAGNGQYGAANVHSGAAGYANGGSYSSANGYQSPNGYSAANGYAGASGYSAANGYSNGSGYQNGSGYPSANGYPTATSYSNGASYQNNNGYANGGGYANGNGYPAADGYSNGAGYQNGSGYGAAGGYAGGGAETQGPQYTPRYRELTSGGASDDRAGGYPDNSRNADGGRQSYRPQPGDRAPRSSDQR